MAGAGNVAAASDGGIDWSSPTPAEPESMKRATYEDVLNAPENKVAEILDGELFLSPRPAPQHIVTSSADRNGHRPPLRRGHGGPGGWWILDEPELHFGEQVVVPDLAGWRRERLPAVPRRPTSLSPRTGSARCFRPRPSASTAAGSSASTPRRAWRTRGSSTPWSAPSRCFVSATGRGRSSPCGRTRPRPGRALRGDRAGAGAALGTGHPRRHPGPSAAEHVRRACRQRGMQHLR